MNMKKISAIMAAAMMTAAMLAGCGAEGAENSDITAEESFLSQQENVENPVTFTDSLGRSVTVASPERTAVFTGSYADIWQLAGGTVFASTEDAFDGRLYTLPEDTLNIGSMSAPSLEMLIENDVDFIILSSNVQENITFDETLDSVGINHAYFQVESFDEYLDMLKVCTDITGRADLYEKNGEALSNEIEEYIAEAQKCEPKTVLFMKAFSTNVKARSSDNMTGKMLSDMNFVNIADLEPSLLEDLSVEKIIEQDPDFIFITTMGSDEEKAIKSYEDILASNPAWNDLTAVKEGRCIFLSKQLFHYKPNARWDEAYKTLLEYISDDEA